MIESSTLNGAGNLNELPYVQIILLASLKSNIPCGEDTSNCNL